MPSFPQGFLWGASTSAFQVQGGDNDFSRFFAEHAAQMAAAALEPGPGKSMIAPHLHSEAASPANYIAGDGIGHKDLTVFRADIERLARLGVQIYRMSVEWSDIEPQCGIFDRQAIQRERQKLEIVKEHGLKVLLTIWHFTNPVWVSEQRGWLNRRTIRYFGRYAEHCTQEFGDLVDYWAPMNEIGVYSMMAYLSGAWPPAKQADFIGYLRCVNNLIRGHRAAARAIRKYYPVAEIGVAQNNTTFTPRPNRLLNRLAARVLDWVNNLYVLWRIRRHVTFIGINHYFPLYCNVLQRNLLEMVYQDFQTPLASDLGWEVSGSSMYRVLMSVARFGLPIFITENGLADGRDAVRPQFLEIMLRQVHQAIQDGADVRGYLHWSAFDNFEWALGWCPRFGLIGVDRETGQRKVRPSAHRYAEIIQNNGW